MMWEPGDLQPRHVLAGRRARPLGRGTELRQQVLGPPPVHLLRQKRPAERKDSGHFTPVEGAVAVQHKVELLPQYASEK